MAKVNKIDSNFTELRYAEETSVGVLPATPVWNPLDPNAYDTFGGKIKTVARNPINSSRQRKKGVVVDLDASAGFELDLTQDNVQPLMQGYLFASFRTKSELTVANVDNGTNAYQPASGGAAYFANDLLFAKGTSVNANNLGLKKVSGVPSGASIPVTGSVLTTEAGAAITVSRVGVEFGAGVAAIDASGLLPKLTVSGNAAATGTLTFTGQPANNDTVTIDGKVYTFQTVLTNVDGNVKIAATSALSIVNLQNAINLNGVGVPGTDYALAMTQHPSVTVTSTATTLVATAIVNGTSGNSIATTKTGANDTWGGATLSGGLGRSLLSYGLTVGEWVCLGDDVAANQFATTADNGLKRVRVIANNSITFDKSTALMVTDAGAAKTIRMFFGRLVKNETGSLVKRRSYQFERALGQPDDASPNTQYEYLIGSIADKLEINIKQATKVTMKLNFMSRDHQPVAAGVGAKAGTRPVLQDADAFNATSHVVRLSLAVVDPTTATPTDLFAFVTDLKLTVDNGVKANKAVKFLGAFDNTAGTLAVDADCTAYFADVAAISAVRNNSDATIDMTFAQHNKGLTFDLPLISIGDALAQAKQDEAIMLPITNAAATGAKLDVNLNHTLLCVFWDYLPSLAA